MNKFKCLISSFSLIILISFLSCSKKRIENDKTLDSYTSTNQYLDSRKQQEQIYEDNGQGSGPIIGQQGTELYVSADIFMYPNGDSVDYPYSIGLIELYKPKDMIYYQMPTYGSNHILFSGGEIHVRAFKDTTDLVLRPGRYYRTMFPADSINSSMKVFHGTETNGIVDWIQSTDYIQPVQDSLGINYYFNTYASAIGWINCDYFASYSGVMAPVSFTSTTDDLSGVAIFIYFPDINSVMQVYNMTSASIPVGYSVKIICIGADNNMVPFYFYSTLTTSSSNSVDVEMQQTTDADLDALLSGL